MHPAIWSALRKQGVDPWGATYTAANFNFAPRIMRSERLMDSLAEAIREQAPSRLAGGGIFVSNRDLANINGVRFNR